MKDVLGVVVTGGAGLLTDLGVADDAALTPFAGKYRFIDFALATLGNSGIPALHVAPSRRVPALRAHLASSARGVRVLRPPLPGARGRGERALRALLACSSVVSASGANTIVLLGADHLLRLDVGRLIETHRRWGASLTLCGMPVPASELDGRAALPLAHAGRIRRSDAVPGSGMACAWTGDLVASAAVLPALAALLGHDPDGADADLLDALAAELPIHAHDPLAHDGRAVFWHDPGSIEAYYEAQMNLCTPRPTLDLYDPAWPIRAARSALPPAKVVADAAGRPGQTLNALVSSGTVVRGGLVLNTVLGHGVVVESGAEIEDSVLLDGCRVGRGARVRRAVVGVGAVIGDAGEIGYGRSPAPPARMLPSGLTVVPAIVEPGLAAAGC